MKTDIELELGKTYQHSPSGLSVMIVGKYLDIILISLQARVDGVTHQCKFAPIGQKALDAFIIESEFIGWWTPVDIQEDIDRWLKTHNGKPSRFDISPIDIFSMLLKNGIAQAITLNENQVLLPICYPAVASIMNTLEEGTYIQLEKQIGTMYHDS